MSDGQTKRTRRRSHSLVVGDESAEALPELESGGDMNCVEAPESTFEISRQIEKLVV